MYVLPQLKKCNFVHFNRKSKPDLSIKSLVDVSRKIGFTASASGSVSSWNSGTLIFPAIIRNNGNGYNPGTGVFTAPRAGTYVFYVNVQCYYNQDIHVDIVLNGATQVRAMAQGTSGPYDASSNLVVLILQKEDRVWVNFRAGKGYYSDGPMTTFSGFQIC